MKQGRSEEGVYTILAVPHLGRDRREWVISRALMQGVKLGALGVFVATLLLAVNYHIAALDSIRTEKLRLENQRLSYALAGVQNQLHQSAETLNHLSDDDRKLRIWAEIQDVDSDTRQLGVGGGESASPDWAGKVSDRSAGALRQAYVDLDRLNRQSNFLARSFSQIEAALTRSAVVRDHTPSILPVPTDVDYWISSRYGYRNDPYTGRREFHNGIDIAGHRGTPIYATADGTVQKVERDRLIGYYVALDHGHGMRTVYGHLQGLPDLRVGQRVERGQQIGKMGNSGRSTGPHVHYTVYQGGRTKNPTSFIFNRGTDLTSGH